jgi:FAD/FMN-containing dehydrogenase
LSGLAGGANPHAGEWVLSLEKLNAIESIDEVGGTAIVQAGVTLQTLQERVAELGWFFPVDLGARGSCQVGGNTATNAGGIRVLRFGMMRESVLGLEVALADGTLLTMLNRVLKNNAGFDLKHLFIGTEGALGVITRLSVRLAPLAGVTARFCARCHRSRPRPLLRAKRGADCRSGASGADVARLPDAAGSVGNARRSSAHPLYALVETLGSDEEAAQAAMERFLEARLDDGTVNDAVLAQSTEQAKGLWVSRGD